MRVEHLRKTKQIKDRVVAQVEKYLADNNSFHVERKTLPFMPDLKTLRRSIGEVESLQEASKILGIETVISNKPFDEKRKLSIEEIMKLLGYKSYSDIYYRFKDLEKVKQYRDNDGFVDSYRQDLKLRNFVFNAGKTLDIEPVAVIELICDERLREFFIRDDYMGYLQTNLQKYIKEYASLNNLYVNDEKLYFKYRNFRNYLRMEYDDTLTDNEILEILQIESVFNNFSSSPKKKINANERCRQIVDKIFADSDTPKPKISKQSFSKEDYFFIIKMAQRQGMTIEGYFSTFGIDYVGGRKTSQLSRYKLNSTNASFDKVRERRDEILAQSGITDEKVFSHEEIFEARLNASLQAYSEYQRAIENGEIDMFDFLEKKEK